MSVSDIRLEDFLRRSFHTAILATEQSCKGAYILVRHYCLTTWVLSVHTCRLLVHCSRSVLIIKIFISPHPPPNFIFGGEGGGVYCFHVICPSVRDTFYVILILALSWYRFLIIFAAYCGPGKTEVNNKCVYCSVGYYKSSEGNGPCTKCPDLTTTAAEGAISQANCSIGKSFSRWKG